MFGTTQRQQTIAKVPFDAILQIVRPLVDGIQPVQEATKEQSTMQLTEEIEKLEALLERGVITNEEFHQLKSRLISDFTNSRKEDPIAYQTAHLRSIERQNELARIDREWAIERERYYVRGRYGKTYLPTKAGGLATALMTGIFGGTWTIMALSLMGTAPDFPPFSIVKVLFPLFGIVFTLIGIVTGMRAFGKAIQYEQAHDEYQARRSEHLYNNNLNPGQV
jgi:hypothetical protein